jgi:putative heme-binding domain-containing protein
MKSVGNWIIASLLLLLLPPLARAQRDAIVPDPDPEIERKSFIVAPGFEVNLFAADPLLAKPIQMNFDAAGRLWVACSEVYPMIKPGQKANDKIIVLEDTKGVGRADKTTVFADGLLIPTGVEPGDGGAYVADSNDMLFLSDPDANGKARKRRIILSGFGTEDTHHILHTFRWGMDGMLYFNQSIYIHSHIETPYGVRRLNAGGVWQFRPETMRLEVFLRGFCNPWGHDFDRWGQSFVTDGAFGEGINYGLPGASYVFCQPPIRILAGLNPGSPKHCGLEIVSGRHLPPDWQGNMLTNDFRGHRVCRFVVTEDGAGYASREMPELIKSNHPAFRPIDIKMGPDGAIYIADWYNPIIQHGEVDFRDPRRDLTHGRIWRVTAKETSRSTGAPSTGAPSAGAPKTGFASTGGPSVAGTRPLVPRPKLVGASVESLLDYLKAPEDWTRHFAKRVLKERGAKEVVPALQQWIARLDPRDAEREHHLLEGLWTYQSLDVIEPKLLDTLLNAHDYHARAAAVRVAEQWHERLPNALELLTPRVADDHPRVRLEAVRALSTIQSARAAEIAARALDKPVDKWVDYAVWLTMRDLQSHWLPAYEKGELTFDGNTRHLVFALEAIGSKASVKPLVDLLQAGKVPADREESVLTTVATLGGPAELGMILDGVLKEDAASASRRATLLEGLLKAVRLRNVKPAGDLYRIEKLLTAKDENVRGAAARAVGLWKLDSLRSRLFAIAEKEGNQTAQRQAALEGIVLLGGKESRDALEKLTDVAYSPGVRSQAAAALASLDVKAAARHAVDVLSTGPKDADPTQLFVAFLEQKNGPQALADALKDRQLAPDLAKLGVRTVRNSVRQAPVLIDALTKAGNLTSIRHTLTPLELQDLVADVQKHGDPARGEAIFRRKDQSCFKCHAIAGAGGQVGPDLVSIGASAQVDYLIESILLPSKIIKEGYHSLNVVTNRGKLYTGIKVRETKDELVLRDAEDREIMIPVKDIDERANGGSLMPEGLADPLTRQELVDLVRFLSELGKVGPYSVSKARLVRRWGVLEMSKHRQPSVWTSAYSKVDGSLPLDYLPALSAASAGGGIVDYIAPKGSLFEHGDRFQFVGFQFEATAPGKVMLLFNSVEGVNMALDGKEVSLKERTQVDLPVGKHSLVFAVRPDRKNRELRCELQDVPGSAARVSIVNGK